METSIIRRKISKYCDNIVNESIIKMFEEFYESELCAESSKKHTLFFPLLLHHRSIKSVNDFNDQTFYLDCAMASNSYKCLVERPLTPHEKAVIKNLYNYLLIKYPQNFSVLTSSIINHNDIFRRINEGYKIINRDIFDTLPLDDKWILIEDKSIIMFDFTTINDLNYRKTLKRYIWEDTSINTKTKKAQFNYYVLGLNHLPTSRKNLTASDILRVKSIICKDKNSRTGFVYISHFRTLLLYMSDNNIIKVNELALNTLKMTNVRSTPVTSYYTDEEIVKILEHLKNSYNNQENIDISIFYQLQTIIILFALNTAMRASTICNLKISDLKQTSDGNYVYECSSKTGNNTTYTITPSIKKLHNQIIELTKQYRSEINSMSEYLFIYKRSRGNVIARITPTSINIRLKTIAKQINIQHIGVTGVRNRFMNRIMSNLPDDNSAAYIEALSKHSLNVHYNHYYDGEVNNIAQQLYGVTIGQIDLKGVAMKKTNVNVTKADIVMNGRGYCSVSSCQDRTILDCLMCRYFRCTPDNIPFFEDEIERIDNELSIITNEHEIEFLLARKKLNVEYLFKCYELNTRKEQLQ